MSGFAVSGEESDQVLVPSSHSTINHTGIPGVPAAETFTSGVHASTDHTGITGVNNFDSTLHALTDHSVIPGANGGLAVGTSTTVPANTLTADGHMLMISLRGTGTLGMSNVTLNGQVIAQSVASLGGDPWGGTLLVTRTGGSSGSATGAVSDANNGRSCVGVGGVGSLNWGGAQVIAVNGGATISAVALVAFR